MPAPRMVPYLRDADSLAAPWQQARSYARAHDWRATAHGALHCYAAGLTVSRRSSMKARSEPAESPGFLPPSSSCTRGGPSRVTQRWGTARNTRRARGEDRLRQQVLSLGCGSKRWCTDRNTRRAPGEDRLRQQVLSLGCGAGAGARA